MKTAIEEYRDLLQGLEDYFDACVQLMDDDLRKECWTDKCSLEVFLENYSDMHFEKYGEYFYCN